MTDDNEIRRIRLRQLVSRLGRGGIAKLAKELEVSASYVSRMLSDPSNNQSRPITGDTVLAISNLYPDWLGDYDPKATPAEIADSFKNGSSEKKEALTLLARLPDAEAATILPILKTILSKYE